MSDDYSNYCKMMAQRTIISVKKYDIYLGKYGTTSLIHIQHLDFSNQHLTCLPSILPPTLISLYCDKNKLTSLPASLPDSLERLCCSYNQIDTLPPKLPASLKRFNCSNNLLRTIDTTILPKQLELLDCSHNQLESPLRQLPSTLLFFYVSHNQLSSLHKLPPLLQDLECAYNRLTALGPLPPRLKYLHCNNNLLQCLPLLPDTLQNINATNNRMMMTSPQLQVFGCIADKISQLNQTIYLQMSKERMKHNDFRWHLLYHSANIMMHPRHIQKYLDANILSFDDDSFSTLF